MVSRYDPNRHNRQSIRLKGHDYRQPGAYFITICTQWRADLFGEIIDGRMVLNDAGQIVKGCWKEIPDHFPNVKLDEFVIMPNHVHAIIMIDSEGNQVGAKDFSPPQIHQHVQIGQQVPSLPPQIHQHVQIGHQVPSLPPQIHQQVQIGHQVPSLPPQIPPHFQWQNSTPPFHPTGTSRTVGSIVRGFKIGVTKWMRQNTRIHRVWQRNYYEHIVRDGRALFLIRRYIRNNPAKWAADRLTRAAERASVR